MQNTLGEQLRAALSQWDKEEKQPAVTHIPFKVSNNLNRAAFNEIRDNPGTRKQINDTLVARGYKLNSISAVVGQMLRQGVAQLDDQGVLHVTTPEYVPLKNYKTLQNMKKKQQKAMKEVLVDVRRKKVVVVRRDETRPVSAGAGIAALPAAPAAVYTPAAVPPDQFVMHALETMSVLQARAVYNELKKIFGESK